MKAVIAIDSFKGSLSSYEAGEAAARGIRRVYDDAETCVMPIADGGEGTVDALVRGMNGKLRRVSVKNPLGCEIVAEYGIVGKTAVVEIAAAAGIALLKREELNPKIATTYGVGEMIKDAIKNGCRDFIIGLGGSATNDGGVGMLTALGYEFTDLDGKPIPFGASGLDVLEKIDDKNALPELKECRFNIACDVTNSLCGEFGCSRVFGRQKGAGEKDIEEMDVALARYGALTEQKYKDADMSAKGTGAAGGLGFAFMAYLGGSLCSGIELVLDKLGLEEEIKNADLVITGEGRIDSQTVMGKAPSGIARLAKKYGKPVIAFAGSVARDSRECNRHGIDAIFPILRTVSTLDEAMDTENAKMNLEDTAEQVVRLWKLCR